MKKCKHQFYTYETDMKEEAKDYLKSLNFLELEEKHFITLLKKNYRYIMVKEKCSNAKCKKKRKFIIDWRVINDG